MKAGIRHHCWVDQGTHISIKYGMKISKSTRIDDMKIWIPIRVLDLVNTYFII
jgi:hypothetical protein